MRWMRRLLLFVIPMLLLAACIREGESGAAKSVRERLERSSRGEHALVWESLHPAHQAIVSQEKYVECGEASDQARSPAIENLRITDEENRTVTVAEIGEVNATVVRAEWRGGGEIRTQTFNAINLDGSWRWVLNESLLNQFRNGQCPGIPSE